MRNNRQPKVFYATQVGVDPPTIVLFTNGPELFDNTYLRYLMKTLRDTLPVPGSADQDRAAGEGRGGWRQDRDDRGDGSACPKRMKTCRPSSGKRGEARRMDEPIRHRAGAQTQAPDVGRR